MGLGATIRVWSGDDWQGYILLLLKMYHGPGQFQEIPDKDRGDCGLEGFSREGLAYQCYAAEEPLSIAQLTGKQKVKVTQDIKKFKNNSKQLLGFLSGTKIVRWILVVPRFDSKELLAHTTKKSAEVRNASLAHVGPGFEIQVIKDDHFPVQRAALCQAGAGKVTVEVCEPPEKEVQEWAGKNDGLVKSIDQKLGRLSSIAQPARKVLRDEFLRHYVTGQNMLDHLRREFPSLHEQVLKCQRSRERFLATQSALRGPAGRSALTEVIQQYRVDLDREVNGLSESNVECLAYGAVADWMLRCPLDFPKG